MKINPQPIIETFGRATQQTIANTVGVSRPTIYKWLSGDMLTVDLDVLGKLVVACDATPGDFFTVVAPTGGAPLLAQAADSAPPSPPSQSGTGHTAG